MRHQQKGPGSRDIYESRHNIAERIQWPPTRTMNGNLHPEAAELEKKFSADEHGESEEKTETSKVKKNHFYCKRKNILFYGINIQFYMIINSDCK